MKIILVLFFIFLFIESPAAQIRIKAAGDMMLGSVTPRKIVPPDSGNVFVKSIGDYLKDADFLFGNLEGTFISEGMRPAKCSDTSRAAGRCYEFGMPEYLAPSLVKMGFDVLNLDNNHSEDYGNTAYQFSIKKLSELKILPLPKREYKIVDYENVKIAFVPFGYSGNSFDINDIEYSEKIIKEVDAQADLIIVSFHGGAEGKDKQHITRQPEIFLGEERGNLYAFAHAVIDAGADLVIGHGPHVLRGIEYYKNKLIAYSLGNFLTYGNMSISGVSGVTCILDVIIDKNRGDFLRGKIIPVKQVHPGIPYYDSTGEAVKIIKKLSNTDFPGSPIIFFDDGYFLTKIFPVPEIRGPDLYTFLPDLLNKKEKEILLLLAD